MRPSGLQYRAQQKARVINPAQYEIALDESLIYIVYWESCGTMHSLATVRLSPILWRPLLLHNAHCVSELYVICVCRVYTTYNDK